MDKNLLWAVTLSILVYALWFGFVEKRYLKPPAPVIAGQDMQSPGRTASSGGTVGMDRTDLAKAAPAAPAQSQPATAAPAASASGPGAPMSAADRKAVEAEADVAAMGNTQVRIHPRGAAIVSSLYKGPLGIVELVHDPRPGLFATWTELRFEREAGGEVQRYTALRPDGLRIVKEFLPEGETALPRIRVRVVNPTRKTVESGGWSISVGPGLDTVPGEMAENASVWRAFGLLSGKKGRGGIDTFNPGAHMGPYRWAGIDNRYFLAVMAPNFADFEAVESASPPRVALHAKSVPVPPGGEHVWEIPYYLGAKGHTWLTRFDRGLEYSIDFGWFTQIGRMMLKLLGRIHGWTGNWGWAIVIMTFLIQALLFPLTYKSMKSMGAMKRLQPEISRLQQKYSKDPQRLNAEMMELYKKSGANPLGGCLPLMLQMPVFVALFNALRNAWELHGAPWMFWVKDLSAKDPYYVLPVIMGGVMFLQNRMNPTVTSDPSQKMMMTWMPVIFTFMFLSSPAGLVLYWLTSSILSASIQMSLKSHFEKA